MIIYEFPPVGGGGGKVAEDICRGLAKRGHEVRVQTARVTPMSARERRDGYELYRSFSLRRRADRCSVPEMAGFIVTNMFPSLRHALRWKPDVMHIHFAVPSGPVGMLVSLMTGVPYVLTAHLGDVPGGAPEETDHLFRLLKPFTIPIWRRASAATAVSKRVCDLAEKHYRVPVRTIHNGIDLSTCLVTDERPFKPVRMLFASRLTVQKQPVFLIDLLARVADLEWTLDVFGDGPLRSDMYARVQQAGLIERVRMHGWVSPQTVREMFGTGDILLMPSIYEGLSMTGLQAVGAGLAIVGSDVGGVNDLVENGVNGFLCPPTDILAFERSLRRILDTDLLLSMKRASRRVAKKFELETVVDQYEKILVDATR